LHTFHREGQGETVDNYERLTETWTIGGPTTVSAGPFSMAGLRLVWSASYVRHDLGVSAPTGTGPCARTTGYATVDGSGGGSKAFDVAITPLGGGGMMLNPVASELGSFDAPLTYFSATCDGLTQTMTSMNVVPDSYAELSGFISMSPAADDPKTFTGSKVYLHDESTTESGTELVDWTVSWDVRRTR
jgi:hypothetical protein